MLVIKKIARELVEKTKVLSKKEQEKVIRSYVYSLGSRGLSKYFSRLINEVQKLQTTNYKLPTIIQSAHPLDKKTLSHLEKELHATYGDIEIEVKEHKELLGGIRIKVGDTLIDATLRNRLKKLQSQLVTSH